MSDVHLARVWASSMSLTSLSVATPRWLLWVVAPSSTRTEDLLWGCNDFDDLALLLADLFTVCNERKQDGGCWNNTKLPVSQYKPYTKTVFIPEPDSCWACMVLICSIEIQITHVLALMGSFQLPSFAQNETKSLFLWCQHLQCPSVVWNWFPDYWYHSMLTVVNES